MIEILNDEIHFWTLGFEAKYENGVKKILPELFVKKQKIWWNPWCYEMEQSVQVHWAEGGGGGGGGEGEVGWGGGSCHVP